MANLQNYLEKDAVNSTKNKPLASEFDVTILLLWFFRVVIIGVSVYSGYFFFNTYLLGHVQNPYLVLWLSILISLFVEFLGNSFLDKMFKFAFKRNFRPAVALFFAACIFYSMSFYSSTNGLALRQYAKNDTTNLIIQNGKIENDNLKIETTQEIKTIQVNIDLLKRQTWNGKLSPKDIETIKEYNNRIFALKTDLQAKIEAQNGKLDKSINETKIHANNESNKFYNFALCLMVFQVLTAGMIRYFKTKIYQEVDSILAKSEQTKTIIDNLSSIVWSTLIDRTNNMTNLILSNFNRNNLLLEGNQNIINAIGGTQAGTIETTKETFQKNEKTPVNTNETINPIVIYAKEKDFSIKGFYQQKNVSNETNETTKNTNETIKSEVGNLPYRNTVKICLNCGREFKPYNVVQKFCSNDNKCKLEYHAKVNGFDLNVYRKGKNNKKAN